jgi:DNA-binding NarL/FixJ family response regulator
MQQMVYKVLVVDDSPIIVDRVFDILGELECITFVGKATSFSEAVTLLAEQKYDLAMLDINLPGKNGIELLSYIKSNYPHIKIVMLSNQSDDYYRNLCSNLGSDSFIDKTSEFENIPQTISRYFNDSIAARS